MDISCPSFPVNGFIFLIKNFADRDWKWTSKILLFRNKKNFSPDERNLHFLIYVTKMIESDDVNQLIC